MKPLITLYAVYCHDYDPEFFLSEEDARNHIEHSRDEYGEQEVEWYKNNTSIQKIEVADYKTIDEATIARHNMSRDEFLSRKISILERAFKAIEQIMEAPYISHHTALNRDYFAKLDGVVANFRDFADHLKEQTWTSMAHGSGI